MFCCSIVLLLCCFGTEIFMSKIKSIKLLLSIIFKRFAVFFGLIKRGLKCSKESLQHIGGFYIGSNTLIQHFSRPRVHMCRIYAINTKSIVLAPDIQCLWSGRLAYKRSSNFSSSAKGRFFYVFRGKSKRDRLSQSPSLLISGSGSWPQRESSRSLVRFYRRKQKKSTARASCSW